MRIIMCLCFIIACWLWGDIKNWKKYYPTVLYMIICQLLYSFFVNMDGDYYLWRLEKDFFINRTFSTLIITFLNYPCLVMLFLANYPSPLKKQIVHMIKWGAISAIIETIMFLSGKVTYHHGWNYWWSIAFDFTIFPMLRFHYVKPIPAWIVSFLFAAFYLIFFHVPLE